MLDSRLILITLLIKLGVAAAVSSALARARTFQNLLFTRTARPRRPSGCSPSSASRWAWEFGFESTVPNFFAADISFETTIILGILLGPLSALDWRRRARRCPPCFTANILPLPFLLAVAITAGLYGQFVDKEEVWSFSPFVDLSIYRWVRRNLRKPRIDRQVLLLILIVGMEIVRA